MSMVEITTEITKTTEITNKKRTIGAEAKNRFSQRTTPAGNVGNLFLSICFLPRKAQMMPLRLSRG